MANAAHQQLKYKRILLKCSGEALMGSAKHGIDPAMLNQLAANINEIVRMGVEVGLVIGGGNLFRGKKLALAGIGRVTGDQMGMLATVMNALAVRDALERLNMTAHIMSAIPMTGVVDSYNRRQAMAHLQNGQVVLFTAGVGNPFFTTDTAACLRAIEIEADIVLKATKVDGIYSADPLQNPEAIRYDYLSYQQILHENLQVMDLTAVCLCQEQNMPLQVFDMTMPNALQKIVVGERIGTRVGVNDDQ